MSATRPVDPAVRVVIRRVHIRSTSSIDAHRLADGIGPALERVLGPDAWPDAAGSLAGRALPPRRKERPADRAAQAIAVAITNRLREAAP